MAPMALLRQAADMAGRGFFSAIRVRSFRTTIIRRRWMRWGRWGCLDPHRHDRVADQKENALADLKAAYSLGNRLASERLTLGELRTGAHLMSESAAELARMDRITRPTGTRRWPIWRS